MIWEAGRKLPCAGADFQTTNLFVTGLIETILNTKPLLLTYHLRSSSSPAAILLNDINHSFKTLSCLNLDER